MMDETTAQIMAGDGVGTIEDFGKGLDTFFADQAKFNAEMSSYDDALRIALNRGVSIRKTADMPPAEVTLIEDRLEVIAKKEANTPIGAAAAKNLAAWRAESTQQPQQKPASAPAAPAQQPTPPPADAPATQPQPTPIAPAAPPPKPTEAKAAQSEPAKSCPVELPPGPPPQQSAAQPSNLHRRRTRVLTPEERSALTKVHTTSKPKLKDDTPETMPAHAQRRRPALHDDEPPHNEGRQIIPPSATASSPPPPSPAARGAGEPDVPPAAAVTPAPTPPATARAPEPEPSRQKTTTTAKPTETDTVQAATSQTAEPPPIGPTIDIAALPEAKKRKKKKFSELSAEERRRIFVARQRPRSGPQR